MWFRFINVPIGMDCVVFKIRMFTSLVIHIGTTNSRSNLLTVSILLIIEYFL